MIPATFQEFVENIRAHAALLRRHGLADPLERSKGYKAPKRLTTAVERVVSVGSVLSEPSEWF